MVHYIYSDKNPGWVQPSREHEGWRVLPQEGGWSSGTVAGDRSRLRRLKTDSGLHALTLSGAETTRHDTGGDAKLT